MEGEVVEEVIQSNGMLLLVAPHEVPHLLHSAPKVELPHEGLGVGNVGDEGHQVEDRALGGEAWRGLLGLEVSAHQHGEPVRVGAKALEASILGV